jgi:hypothetical protein
MATKLPITVTVPNLRNGAAEDITQAAPRASIPAHFKWAHIQHLASADYPVYVDAVIRAQYAQLMAGITGGVTDAARAQARNTAIVLGAVRAGAAAAYNLAPHDFNAEEVVGTSSTFTAGTDAVPATDTAAAQAAVGATIGTTAGTAGALHTVAQGMEAVTEEEVAVINTVMYLGMAVPAMQGISLTVSGHHFLPTTKNTFLGMKRQASQAGGQLVASWIDARGDEFDDWAFHKACHPILPALKRTWAKSPQMAARLVASGHGAAAIRIPALPSDAQAGKASLAVFMKAAPVIRSMGHTIAYSEGQRLISVVEQSAEGRDEMVAVNNVRAWFVAHTADIAFCAGIVQHLAETTGATRESTLRAFSIKKAMADSASEVSRGITYCRAHLARLRDQAADGTFPDPRITA